jgi:hypothetical protein
LKISVTNCSALCEGHGVVAILLEVEREQILRAGVDGGEKEARLRDAVGIGAEVVGAPPQAGCNGAFSPESIGRVAVREALRRLVDHTDDVAPLDVGKARNLVVVGEVDHHVERVGHDTTLAVPPGIRTLGVLRLENNLTTK